MAKKKKNGAAFVFKWMRFPPPLLPSAVLNSQPALSPPRPQPFYYQLNHVSCQAKGHSRSSWRGKDGVMHAKVLELASKKDGARDAERGSEAPAFQREHSCARNAQETFQSATSATQSVANSL